MDVEIKQLPEMRVAAIRHVGAYDQINEAFHKLAHVADSAGMFAWPDAQMVALYYDDPESTPAERLRSDAGLTMPPDATLPTGLTEQRIPSGTYASATYVGPYENLPDVWSRFMRQWLPASGRTTRDDAPSYEVYLNDPTDTPKEKLITEIRLPLSQ